MEMRRIFNIVRADVFSVHKNIAEKYITIKMRDIMLALTSAF